MCITGCFSAQMLTIGVIFSRPHNNKLKFSLLGKLTKFLGVVFSFELIPFQIESLIKM